MTDGLPPSLGYDGDRDEVMRIVSDMKGSKGVFTCTIGNTLTSTIPGVSDAGDTPELTMYTGPADAEFLFSGKVTCMDGIPINPGGIPTPATLTKAALNLSGMPFFIVDGGTRVKANIPMFDMGGSCGEKITTGHAVKNAKQCFERGRMLGRYLGSLYDYVVISESCAGGTTTALAVLTAMGTVSENLVSSSSPNNPKALKSKLVSEGIAAAGKKPGDFRDDPLGAIEAVGDPMMPVNVGMLIGASENATVVVGGGTQMAAVMDVALKLEPSILGRFFQGTTRWLMKDRNSSMIKLRDAVNPRIPIIYVNMDYSGSPYEGLRAYEQGFIKEGVGCGGASVSAILSSPDSIDCGKLLDEVHSVYRGIMGSRTPQICSAGSTALMKPYGDP